MRGEKIATLSGDRLMFLDAARPSGRTVYFTVIANRTSGTALNGPDSVQAAVVEH